MRRRNAKAGLWQELSGRWQSWQEGFEPCLGTFERQGNDAGSPSPMALARLGRERGSPNCRGDPDQGPRLMVA
jgi:hypothetical protein